MRFRLVEGIPNKDINIETYSTDAYYNQVNMVKEAQLDGKLVGYLDYSVYENKPYVQMIEVAENYRRQGIAYSLLKSLQDDFPGISIDTGMLTGDGSQLVNSVMTTVENDEYTKLEKESNDIDKKLSDIQLEWEKFWDKIDSMDDDEVDSDYSDWAEKLDAYEHSLINRKREIDDELRDMKKYFTYVK